MQRISQSKRGALLEPSFCLSGTRIAIRVTTQAILQNKTNLLIERSFVAELETIYSYMREFSTQLGERILEEYPALQSFEDPISPRLDTLLRRPFPAQNIAIMSVAKRWEQFRTALIVAECGTG
jgi:hypothetical protein